MRVAGSLLGLVLLLAAAATGAEEPPHSAPTPQEREGYASTLTVIGRTAASATTSSTVVSRESVEASGARTAGDLLFAVPGLRVSSAGTRGGFTAAEIRGGDANFTLVLLDGVPLNDPTDPLGGAFNLDGIPASAIDHVRVVRGPLSTYLGSSALGGIIDIRSRAPAAGETRAEVAIDAGDASYLRTTAALLGGHGAVRSSLLLSHDESAGKVADESFDATSLVGGVSIPLARARLSVHGRAGTWQADDYPEASGGPALGDGALRHSDNDDLSLGGDLDLGERGPWRNTFDLSFARHALDRASPAIGEVVPDSDERTRYDRLRLAWLAKRPLHQGLDLATTLEVEREHASSVSALTFSGEPGDAIEAAYDRTRSVAAASLGVSAARGPAVVELSLRGDFPEENGPEVSPRAGASVRLNDDATRLHASIGRAFKLPSFFALASPPALGGNPDLEPETSVGLDAGVEQSLTAHSMTVGATVFHNRFHDLIDFDFDTFQHVNRGEVHASGLELHLTARLLPSLETTLSTTWQRVTDETSSSIPLLHRPRVFGGATLDWAPTSSLGVRAMLEARSQVLDTQLPVPDRTEVAGYGLLAVAVRYHLAGPLTLTGRVDNLTDTDYETFIGFPGPGRSAEAGLRLAWSR